MTAVVVLSAVLGLAAGSAANRAAGAFPWPHRDASRHPALPSDDVAPWAAPHPAAEAGHIRRSVVKMSQRPAGGPVAVRRPLLELATAALFAVTAMRFGASWELPAFLYLAGIGVLLAVIDLRHHLLPNRVVVPSYAVSAALLLLPATVTGGWPAIGRAALGAVVLFAAFLVLALISPSSLGMGDVKLAGLLGLHLGWFGWETLALGGMAGFVVQAALASVLLLSRRIGLRGELPFGPAMLVGTALVIGMTAQQPLG